MPADISHVGDPPERQWLRLMVLDKLPRSRHICRFILFAPLRPVDPTRPKGAAQKCSEAATSRDTDPAIKRTTENKPAQAASNPSCTPRAELLRDACEAFLCRILEHYFARLEKTENVVTRIHWHCAF
jgi:hypothetical protein